MNCLSNPNAGKSASNYPNREGDSLMAKAVKDCRGEKQAASRTHHVNA